MLIEKDIAAEIEACIKQTHIAVTKRYAQGQILELNGGAACFSGINSFLSQVVGWGFTTKPKQYHAEIEHIEAFYKSLKMPHVDIELSPYVGNELIAYLNMRGYQLSEVSNVSVLDLNLFAGMPAGFTNQDFQIRAIHNHEIDEWAKHVALGFGCTNAQEHFKTYASAEGVTAFAAFKHETIVSGAVISIQGTICDLGVTSTLHDFRGRGLQKQLLMARLNYAKQLNLKLATVTTEPGSISDLNIQKIGFHCAYTRIKMTMPTNCQQPHL